MTRIYRLALLILFLSAETGSLQAVPPPIAWPQNDGQATLWAEARAARSLATDPHNVILFVGDGMGPEHVRAAALYLGRPLLFEEFPFRSRMTTQSVNGVTDSAAAATAMATGHRVYNGVISVALPGDGAALETVLERWQALGKRTGLVSTSTITDATPAAFAAHDASRTNRAAIAGDYFEESRPEVLMGGAGSGVTEEIALAAGYVVVTDTYTMSALDTEAVTHVSGQFGQGQMPPINDGRAPLPSMAEMVQTSLAMLQNGDSGFFLLVEQEGTDTYSHANALAPMIDAVIELEGAVNVALDWADERDDTLIVVTADHETGGLHIDADNGAGTLPDVTWIAGSGHTDSPVPLFARGSQAELLALVHANVDLSYLLGPGGFEQELYFPFMERLPLVQVREKRGAP
jgi:alkaline phosphatase